MGQNFIFVLVVLIGFSTKSFAVRQEECLDPACLYILGYEPNLEKEEITFDVLVKTTGYVGFGLAPKAGMTGADIVIGGVKNGKTYFKDYHGTGTIMPELDSSQDWELLEATENSTHTYLKFARFFHSCDTDNDISITTDTINVIWSFGATDDITYHATNRGGRQFLLLDPPSNFTDLTPFKIYEIRVANEVPAAKTSYLCSFHKFPKFETQQYLVGVEAFLENEYAVRHTHHFTVTTCRTEDTELLERLRRETAIKAKDCFEELLYMRNYCNEVLFGWAVGGKRVMLPEHVGIPFGEASSEQDPEGSLYIMLEVHYENPTEAKGVKYTTGFDTFYSDKKREYDGSIIMVGHEVNPALLIPPNANHHVVAGHCSSEVTKELIPEDGVNIIAVNMHSHIAGRQIRVRQYRNGKEIPWILNDVNYDFDYQQTRELRNEIKLYPGDHLTNECVFDTSGRDVVTLGGESTHDEMCHTFLVYYPRIELRGCKSHFPLEKLWPKFGIERVEINTDNLFNPKILAPKSMEGKLFSEVLNALNWTDELRSEIQRFLRFDQHKSVYTAGNYEGGTSRIFLENNFGVPENYGIKTVNVSEFTKYPEVEDYQPEKPECKNRKISNGSYKMFGNFNIVVTTVIMVFIVWKL